jgi:hypothetical protein
MAKPSSCPRLAADIPLAADHFRYFAAAVRAEEGRISEIDDQAYADHFQEPLGVVGPASYSPLTTQAARDWTLPPATRQTAPPYLRVRVVATRGSRIAMSMPDCRQTVGM